MLSDQTKQNIEQVFHKSLRATLIRAPEDICVITAAVAPKVAGPKEVSHREVGLRVVAQPSDSLLVITISSFVFRLLTLFRVATNPATGAYYTGGTSGQSLEEAFCEVANLCCGAFNRELSQHFPHLAMSIPYTLSGPCLEYLEELKPQYLSSSTITINDTVQLQATLCMCCSVPVDFVASTAATEPSSGELEMF